MPLPRVDVRVRGARGHLTFFLKMVRKPADRIEAGSLVDVYDPDGELLGQGFYNPRSQVALRILSWGPSTGDDFVLQRLKSAAQFRQEVLKLPAVTDAYRVCHAEGDGLSGLMVDRYGPVLAVQLFSIGFFRVLDQVKGALAELFPGSRIHVTSDAEIQRLEGFTLKPQPPPEGIVVTEHGLRFRIDFARGHKTGFFCDQRDNRRRVSELAKGRDVLDLCCYTGGFALHAVAGGARKVVGVDMDEEALETARQNARLNHAKVDFLHADIFNYLRQSKETFDLIVLDPPKMARDREEIERARRSYRDMNVLALKVARPGAILVSCSCSGLIGEEEFLSLVRDAARAAGRELSTFQVSGAGPDHPVSALHPEGRYLKVAFSRVT